MARRGLFDEEFLHRLEYLYIVSKKVFQGRLRAERRSKRVGSGQEFADHRDYVPGDDLRYLDWNVYGRLDRLLVRLYEEQEDLTVYLLVDVSTSMTMGEPAKLDYACRVAAALAYIALANLDRVAILPFGGGLRDALRPARGKGQIFKVFDFLEKIEPGGPTDLESSLRAFVQRQTRRGLAVVVSDLYDAAGYEEGLNYLLFNRFEPFVVHLYDEGELRPDLRGDLRVVDCESGQVHDVTVTPRLLRRYREAHAQFCEKVEQHCTKRGITYFRTAVQVPFDELILQVFRAGKFLA